MNDLHRESSKRSMKRVTINESSMKNHDEQQPLDVNRTDMQPGADEQTVDSTSKPKKSNLCSKNNGDASNSNISNNNPDADESRRESTAVRSLYDFFCASRIQPNSIKIPNCNISRGLVIAIIFVLLISSLIVWFIFSSDGLDLDDDDEIDEDKSGKYIKKGNRYKKPTANKSANGTNGDLTHTGGGEGFSKLFVLLMTVLIVIAIVAFVFIGALIHYYKKPNPYMKSRSQSVVSSIFSHHNPHSFLYYLDKDECLNEQNSKLSKKSSKKESSKSTRSDMSVKSNDTAPPPPPPSIAVNNTKPLVRPIIIVNESN